MEPSRLQNNEIDRLSVLYDTDILDSPVESAFDAITQATAKLCDMPMSFVCLVDSERVWFKSSTGLNGVNEIPKEIGFCPHTIKQLDVFEVKNAAIDKRFRNSPLVTQAPHFQYYAGAPLVTSDGYALGTLCVMDYKPRELEAAEKEQLQQLASIITALIEAKRIKEIKKLSIHHRLGDIVEISPYEIYLVDANNEKINYANRTAQLNLGYSSNLLKQLKWKDILSHAPIELISKHLSTNKSFHSSPIEFQASQKRKDNSEYPVECILQASGLGNNEFLVISNDISQRKSAESRERILMNNIAHMNRINATSALASGLAHELNQPLTAVTQYCDTALSIYNQSQNNNEALLEPLQKAASQTIRAGEIVKRFRAFTEKRLPIRKPVCAKELLNETLLFTNHDILQQKITLTVDIKSDTPSFHADSVQIQQVLLNLITNSIQAMEGKTNKHLTIECLCDTANSIEFTITDTGDGIDHVLLDDLIAPASSQKPNGTGLGLCVCKYIIESHNGKLWSDAHYTHGARMKFSIPLSK
ncbi:MAG: ATP-binding protein [Gammaproteobacteria bacterium]